MKDSKIIICGKCSVSLYFYLSGNPGAREGD